MIPPAPDPVVVLAAPGSSLGGALRSALAGRGWAVSQGQQHRAASALAVVVVEDDAGGPWSPPGSLRPGRTIGIGSVRSAAALAALAARGAIVLDQDVPFLALLRLVEDGLRTDTPVGRRLRDATASGLWERAAEARALAELTERERVVLCGLIHGSSAAAIAGEGSRSLATVRSQIQSLLRRLGVRSQLAAVAAAHRSGRAAGLGPCLEALHHF